MENMFYKIDNLAQFISKLTNDDLRAHGVESIMLVAWSTDFERVSLSKGRFNNVMAGIGQMLSRISNKTGMPLKELLDGIYACETEIKQREQEGGDSNDLY